MTKKTKSILCGIGAFILSAGLLVSGIAIGRSVDFKVKQPEEQIEQTEDETSAGNIIVSDNGNKASPLSIRLERIMPLAGTADPVGSDYAIITAELIPASATDKLDLTAAWENPSSAWATGKSVEDYFQLEHEDGAFEATATALQAYGETIVLTGTIRNREITDSIKLDYLAKPKYINNSAEPVNLDSLSDTFQIKMTDIDYEVGSVKPSKITGTVTLTLPTNIYNALKGKGWTDLQQTKSFDYDLLNPTDLKVNIDQFMNRTLSGTELQDFNYDLYWVLNEILDGDPLLINLEFVGNYYAMVNNVETLCGQINSSTCDNGIDVEVSSYADLQTPATDLDLGGDILFY